MGSAKDFLSEDQQAQILTAIREAENESSGEVRVHIESKLKGDVLDRAAFIFKQLNMHKTELRNGVLFYLALNTRNFAIIGDRGIHEKVQDIFWEDLKLKMLEYFKAGDFAGGLSFGIHEAGQQLKKYFPHKKDDINELPDDISFGK